MRLKKEDWAAYHQLCIQDLENFEEGTMRADRVEVSWDETKSKWLVRIRSGEEVIRRHCDLPRNAGEQALQQAAQKTLRDEGYEVDGVPISVNQQAAA